MPKKSLKLPKVKIGTDICQLNRVNAAYKKFGKKFLKKILTEKEIKYVTQDKRSLMNKLAGRFAAKEAFAKVLGAKLSEVDFKDVEILNEKSGAPKIILYKRAKKKANQKKLTNFDVSISHEKEFAIAIVVGLEKPF